MHKVKFAAAALCLSLATFTPATGANDFWSDAELRHSSWNSKYTTPSGAEVVAQLQFDGDEGTYTSRFGQGRLFDVEYGIDTDSMPGKPFFQITGKWSFQGESGDFLLASNGRDKFKGNWQGDIGAGRWTGSAMYGTWQQDPNSDRMYCEYRYPAKDNPAQINVQIVLWYPNDPDRSGYYYFANKQNKIWGRCVCPSNPDYDPDAMQWSKLMGDTWDELPKGDCPAPKDGDPEQSAIGNIPDPPI